MSTGTQVEVVMPQMGVSVSEGTITRWLKQAGDSVALDEPLLEISTDKVDTEVPSPGEGIVAEIRVQEGETVEVGTVLAVIGAAGAAPAAPAEPAAPLQEETPAAEEAAAPAQPSPAAVPEPVAAAPAEQPAPAAAPPAPSAPAEAPSGNGRSFVSPVVARIAAQHGVDPSAVAGTGQGGRVTKKDILAFIESGAAAPPPAAAAAPAAAPAPAAEPEPAPVEVAAAAAPPAAPPAPPAPAPAAPAPAPAAAAAEPAAPAPAAAGEVEEPMTAMRRGVAEHMRRSLDTSAHVTSAIEVDMSRVVAARDHLKKEYQASYGVNPTYLAFISKAAVETLAEWPWVNGEIRGDKIVTRTFVNLGIAVALEDGKGLIVPVIRNAQDLNLLGMARGDRGAGREGAHEEAHARRRPGRHVHDHEPGRLRHLPRDADHQPAAGRHPRHVRARQAPVGRAGRARPGRDRDPADDEHHLDVRPPPRRRRVRRRLPPRPPWRASKGGTTAAPPR